MAGTKRGGAKDTSGRPIETYEHRTRNEAMPPVGLVTYDTDQTKGQDTEQDQVKRRFLDEWVRAVNAHGGFGTWRWGVALQPGEIRDVLMRATAPLSEEIGIPRCRR